MLPHLRLPDLHHARDGIRLAHGFPIEAPDQLVKASAERGARGLVLLLPTDTVASGLNVEGGNAAD